MSGGAVLVSFPRTVPEPRVYAAGLCSVGNACFANLNVVIDLQRKPPFVSAPFGDCAVDLVLIGKRVVVVSARDPSASVDRV